jgi:hypothetical protein
MKQTSFTLDLGCPLGRQLLGWSEAFLMRGIFFFELCSSSQTLGAHLAILLAEFVRQQHDQSSSEVYVR